MLAVAPNSSHVPLSSLALGILSALLIPQCLARGDTPLIRPSEEGDAGTQNPVSLDRPDQLGDLRPLQDPPPHTVLSVDPSHGPFKGGQLAIVRGNGFNSESRVWFGETEVEESDVLPVDPGRVQVVVPAGEAGSVDVSHQNGDDESTRSSLRSGYTYDAFYAEPGTGPTSGGTEIRLHGSNTDWDEDTEVFVDRKPCEDLQVLGPDELTCKTPAGTTGTKSISVTTGDTEEAVLDAFTYGDSDNGFRGGLSGEALDGELTVVALNSVTGNAISGATVILNEGLEDGEVEQTGGSGTARFTGSVLGETATVTVAAPCLQPITFVDVPVDVVTVYLDPILSPVCGDLGEVPPSSRGSSPRGFVRGELVWESLSEFSRDGWTNVPAPKNGNERHIAYLYRLSSNPTQEFSVRNYVAVVTPGVGGEIGFTFSFSSPPGNYTLYALAGIESQASNPPTFTAYSMGLVRGVAARPESVTQDIFIPIDIPLDHGLSVDIDGPQVTDRGPDRVRVNVALRVQDGGYALLPGGELTQLLPSTSSFEFVGLPPLISSLVDSDYTLSAIAATGSLGSMPRSALGAFVARTTGQLTLSGFVEIPRLVEPQTNATWDGTKLQLEFTPGGGSVEVTLVELQSGAGLNNWLVVAPGAMTSIRLPDLRSFDEELALYSGPLGVAVYAAHIEDFDYGSLRYRHLGSSGWDAYASDLYFAAY